MVHLLTAPGKTGINYLLEMDLFFFFVGASRTSFLFSVFGAHLLSGGNCRAPSVKMHGAIREFLHIFARCSVYSQRSC
jgi:hypothetical protein